MLHTQLCVVLKTSSCSPHKRHAEALHMPHTMQGPTRAAEQTRLSMQVRGAPPTVLPGAMILLPDSRPRPVIMTSTAICSAGEIKRRRDAFVHAAKATADIWSDRNC